MTAGRDSARRRTSTSATRWDLSGRLRDHFNAIGGLVGDSDLEIARELVRRARRAERAEGALRKERSQRWSASNVTDLPACRRGPLLRDSHYWLTPLFAGRLVGRRDRRGACPASLSSYAVLVASDALSP